MSNLPGRMIADVAPTVGERRRIALRPADGTVPAPGTRVILNPYANGGPLITAPDTDAPAWESLPQGAPVPGSLGKVNGFDVVALREVPGPVEGPYAGKPSGVFVVIAYRPYQGDRYAVWTVGEFRRERMAVGTPVPTPRSNGRYVFTWDRALEVLAERSATLGAAFFAQV